MKTVDQILEREDENGTVTVTVISSDCETGQQYSGTSSYDRQWELYDRDDAIDEATNKSLNND